jgi:hypothetical protein
MGRDSLTILQYNSTRSTRPRRWVFALGCGFVAGLLLGVGMIGAFSHIKWAIFAGLAVGVASGLIVRSFAMLAALAGGIIAVVTCMSVVVLYQVRVGHWAITDEQTLEHYGSATQAVLRVGLILLPVVCVPCAASAVLASFVKRRAG